MNDIPATVEWATDGERRFAAALDRLSDEDLDGRSLLPGWSRRTVVAHVARNADALVNLLTWARTGEETPMYPSRAARDEAITATAALPAADLRADYAAAADRLATAIRRLPGSAWHATVRTAQGRTVPAAEIPWMRCREVWVHAVDLDAGVEFGDMPEELLAALIDDVIRTWRDRGETPDVQFSSGGRAWGTGSRTVTIGLAELAAWVTGRHGPTGLVDGDPSLTLPRWL